MKKIFAEGLEKGLEKGYRKKVLKKIKLNRQKRAILNGLDTKTIAVYHSS